MIKGDVIRETTIHTMARVLRAHPEIVFAYLHGSFLTGNQPRDVDLAVFAVTSTFQALEQTHQVTMELTIPLEMEIQEAIGLPVDLQVLNQAPLEFRCRVVDHGQLLLDRDPNLREDFELLTRKEYWDFRPILEEHLQEALKGA
jgi:predicted nucleotidyltransferase